MWLQACSFLTPNTRSCLQLLRQGGGVTLLKHRARGRGGGEPRPRKFVLERNKLRWGVGDKVMDLSPPAVVKRTGKVVEIENPKRTLR